MKKLPRDIAKKTEREYRKVPALKELLNTRKERYDEALQNRLADPDLYIPYRSSADIELDVPVRSGYSHDGPQARLTIAFKTKYEEDILKLAGEIADLEEILDYAIEQAVKDARQIQKRKQYRRDLEAHLYKGISVNELETDKATLRKYKDKALCNAAEMLGYI